MDTEKIASEENDELTHEVDAIVGEWDILEFYYRKNWFTNTCIKLTDSHLISKFNIDYTPEGNSPSHAPTLLSLYFLSQI